VLAAQASWYDIELEQTVGETAQLNANRADVFVE
jgi:hypothetical protein